MPARTVRRHVSCSRTGSPAAPRSLASTRPFAELLGREAALRRDDERLEEPLADRPTRGRGSAPPARSEGRSRAGRASRAFVALLRQRRRRRGIGLRPSAAAQPAPSRSSSADLGDADLGVPPRTPRPRPAAGRSSRRSRTRRRPSGSRSRAPGRAQPPPPARRSARDAPRVAGARRSRPTGRAWP